MLRSVYVLLRCTDPDWDGTATEQTIIHQFFFSRLYILKLLYLLLIYTIFIINPAQQLIQ